MRERDDTPSESTPEHDDRVGLGRVVEDRRTPPRDPGRPRSGTEENAEPNGIQEASEESFPASDPPTFMSDQATPRDR